LLTTEFNAMSAQEATLNAQVSAFLAIPNLRQNATLLAQVNEVLQQDELLHTEVTALLNQIGSALGLQSFEKDRLLAGTGGDTFYGNVHGATQMGGGTGNQTFYNYNASDTVQGNATGVNTLVLRDADFTALNPNATSASPNVITLSQDANGTSVDVTVN